MIKKLISQTRKMKKGNFDFETIEYWESTTEESVASNIKLYWEKVKQSRNKEYTVKEIAKITDVDVLNILFAEEIMGWVWSDKPVVFIEEFLPGGFLMNEKVKTNITHYTHKCTPVLLPDFTSGDYVVKIIDRLKDSNIKYGLQPTADGYEVYCEKHRISIYGKTLGEVVSKLALVTLTDVYSKYNF